MASALQQAVLSIQLNNYLTRVFVVCLQPIDLIVPPSYDPHCCRI